MTPGDGCLGPSVRTETERHADVFSTVVCFDAKINFDDNAEFRQKDVFAMDNTAESDPTETEAAKYDLKYIGLDGNIACFGEFFCLFVYLKNKQMFDFW